MEYRGVEYTVVQLLEGGWRWEIDLGDGKRKSSGETPVSRAFAIKIAEAEIDRFITNRK